MGARHMAEWHFRDRGARLQQREQQVLVLRRIDPVLSAGEHRDGAAGKAGAMRRLVDAAGKAYMMAIKSNQPELYKEAQRLLWSKAKRSQPEAELEARQILGVRRRD